MERNIGRPKSDKGQRTIRVTVTFHQDEYDRILRAAKKPTTFIRLAALKAAGHRGRCLLFDPTNIRTMYVHRVYYVTNRLRTVYVHFRYLRAHG